MERAASGVRPYIANWYNDVFIPAFKDLDGKPNEFIDENSNTIIKERHVGVTTEQLAEKTKKVYGGLKPSSGDLLNKYLYPLINQGIVDKVPSEIDKRSNLYVTTGGNNIFALFQDPDDIRLKAPFPSAYPTTNIVEDSTRFSLECYYKGEAGNRTRYRLIDVDGEDLTPSGLAEKYFGSPEGCFIKDDETLKEEYVAMNIASITNSLVYSQIIRHKIIPSPTCNNILTESYNSHIEDSSNVSSGSDTFDSILLEDEARTQGSALERMAEDTKEKDDGQIGVEVHDAGGSIKPENNPTYPLELSQPINPSQTSSPLTSFGFTDPLQGKEPESQSGQSHTQNAAFICP